MLKRAKSEGFSLFFNAMLAIFEKKLLSLQNKALRKGAITSSW